MRIKLGSMTLLLLLSVGGLAQTAPPASLRLSKLECEGLQKVSKEKAIEVSGLSLGQSLKLDDLNTVTDKLYASGLFARARYNYSWMGEQLEVVFRVEEAKLATLEPAAAPQIAKPNVLGRIEFTGLQRCDHATVTQVVGLKTGEAFDQQQLDAAAKRLAETGYFAELNYSFATQDGQANVRFKVVEAKWEARCLFDNFIWLTQPEIYAAIRREIPLFEDSAPDNVHIVNRLTAILDQLLQQHGIARKTSYLVVTGNIDDEKARSSVSRHRCAAACMQRALSWRDTCA
jgi:outer membrane protein assembly factor BamA